MPKKITFEDDVVARILRQYEDGLSTVDIASEIGVATNTIRRVLAEHGVVFTVEAKGARIRKKVLGRIGPRNGAVLSDETKQKMSTTKKAKQYPPETFRRVFSDATKEKMRQAARVRWADNIAKKEALVAEKAARPTYDYAKFDAARSLCKRLVRRVLRATGRRKEIPSAKYLGYSKHEFLAALGSRPDGCELDHIVPVAEFLRRGIYDPAVINALCNLQYIPKAKNREKSDTLPPDVDNLIAKALVFRGDSYEKYFA